MKPIKKNEFVNYVRQMLSSINELTKITSKN